MNKRLKMSSGITLVALVVTIIVLLVLAGITIATLNGENGLFSKVKQGKKAHIQAEMQEQLTLALNGLQIDKSGSANLDDVTQEWISSAISGDFNPVVKEDASIDGKFIIMNKSDITGKFLINQNLEISKTEYNISTLEFEYETGKLENGKVKILIKIIDKVNGIKQIDYPDSSKSPLIMDNRKEAIGIDYIVEMGKEYKFTITTGDGQKTEKTIKIDDYFYNVIKDFGEGVIIDNNVTKVSYSKTYEASIATSYKCYEVVSLTVTMGGKNITTSGNNVVDINTGKIKIEKVTGDINIKVVTKFNKSKVKENIIINPSTTDWTNQNIQVDVDWGFDGNNVKKEISIDNGVTYNDYVGSVEVEKNTTVIAKLIIDNEEIKKELKIANIDKLEPKGFSLTVDDSVSSTELIIRALNVKDTEENNDYGCSGIKEYKYFVYDDKNVLIDSIIDSSNQWTVSGLSIGSQYKIFVEAYDNAGNCKRSSEETIEKKKIYSWSVYNLIKEGYYTKVKTGSNIYRYIVDNGYGDRYEPSFDSKTGKWHFTGRVSYTSAYYWFTDSNSAYVNVVYRCIKRANRDHYGLVDVYSSQFVGTYSKGDNFIKTVTSDSESAYPENNYQGNYWYVKNQN